MCPMSLRFCGTHPKLSEEFGLMLGRISGDEPCHQTHRAVSLRAGFGDQGVFLRDAAVYSGPFPRIQLRGKIRMGA